TTATATITATGHSACCISWPCHHTGPASVAGTRRCRIRVLVPPPACSTFLARNAHGRGKVVGVRLQHTKALMSPASMRHGPTESRCGSVLSAGHGPAPSLTRRVAPPRPATATTVDLAFPPLVILLQCRIDRSRDPRPSPGNQRPQPEGTPGLSCLL